MAHCGHNLTVSFSHSSVFLGSSLSSYIPRLPHSMYSSLSSSLELLSLSSAIYYFLRFVPLVAEPVVLS